MKALPIIGGILAGFFLGLLIAGTILVALLLRVFATWQDWDVGRVEVRLVDKLPYKYGVFSKDSGKALLENVASWRPSPDGGWLVVETDADSRHLIDCKKGILMQGPSLPPVEEWAPDFSRYLAMKEREPSNPPDPRRGDLLLVITEGQNVRVETLFSEKDKPVLRPEYGSWSPDGTGVGFVVEDARRRRDLYRMILKASRAADLVQEDVGDKDAIRFAWDGDRPRLLVWRR